MKNYYLILNVSKSADNDAIKKAYRQAALFWHPDKNKSINAQDKFIEINEAYNILVDPDKRMLYDNLYEEFFKVKQDLSTFKEAKKEYKVYEQWVNFERGKAEKLSQISSDEILTDTFHFIDRYGLAIVLTFFGLFFLFVLIFISLDK
jgi:curved DNA-binding protein CbpA